MSARPKDKFNLSSEIDIIEYRAVANRKYILSKQKSELNPQIFLTPEEELVIVRNYEYELKEFLQKFQPKLQPLPKDVRATTFYFFKRFFLVSSVMDFHPKEIMMTCIYLACKVCEYIVPIDIFVSHINGNPRLLKNIILDQELELLDRLNFAINIHTPHRPVDGLMCQLKAQSILQRPERLYEFIFRFLSNMWHTDICLTYSPTLIGLAAVMHAVSRCKENIDEYIMKSFLKNPQKPMLDDLISTVRKIRAYVVNVKQRPTKEEMSVLETRLAQCRNPRNDPSSELFKRRMMEFALEAYGKSEEAKM